MKLYIKPEAPTLVRLTISRTGNKTYNMILEDTTVDKTISFCRELIADQKISPLTSATKVSIVVREYTPSGGLGKGKSMSLRGMSTDEVYKLIMKNIDNE